MNAAGVLGRRWSNEKNPGRYITNISDTKAAVADSEDIDLAKAAGESMFLGLRMTEGVSSEIFRNRFGKTPVELYPQINTWREGQLIEEEAGFLRLTSKGLMVANSIFVQFM